MLSAALRELATAIAWQPETGLALVTAAGPRLVPPEGSLAALRDHLYARHFCRWMPPLSRVAPTGDPAFVASLVAALEGRSAWEGSWRVRSTGAGWAFVSNGEVLLFVDDMRGIDPPNAGPGEDVAIAIPCARPMRSPGFFYFVSPAGGVRRDEPIARLYLNLDPAFGRAFVEFALRELGAAPFEAKLVNDPTLYGRVEPVVIYLSLAHYSGALERLLSWHRAHPAAFRPDVPLFTLPLADGLAAAESPAGRPGETLESFGQHRCRLVAEAVLGCLHAGDADPAAWSSAVATAFDRAGLSPAHPYVQHLAPEVLAHR